jgi:hypothetical protein
LTATENRFIRLTIGYPLGDNSVRCIPAKPDFDKGEFAFIYPLLDSNTTEAAGLD